MSDAKNEQGRDLARLREQYELGLNNLILSDHGLNMEMGFFDDGCDPEESECVREYVTALGAENKRLAAIVDGMTVVEVGACDGNPGASGCPCYAYGDGNDDWCLYLDNSLHGKDLPPHDCPLKSGPVLLKLKD